MTSWSPSLPVVRPERPLSAAVAQEQRNPCELQAEEGGADDEGDELPGRGLSRLIGRRRCTTANHRTVNSSSGRETLLLLLEERFNVFLFKKNIYIISVLTFLFHLFILALFFIKKGNV